MINETNPLLNETLTLEEFIQTKPDSVKKLVTKSMRILNTFTDATYQKTFSEIVAEYSILDKDTRQDKILFVLKRFSLWCQIDTHHIISNTLRWGTDMDWIKKRS